MGRKPTGGKRGRKTDMTDEQIAFLESYGERFQDRSRNGVLYSEVVNKWIETFGYDNTKYSISDLHLDEDLDMLSPEQRGPILKAREDSKQTIREKLGNWFRHRYHHRKEHQEGIDEVLRSLLQISATRPRKKTTLAMYSDLHYDDKLKAPFDVMWKGCLLNGIPPKERIKFIKNFTQENWLKESDDFRAEIQQKCEAEYVEALNTWKARTDWSATLESYAAALANLDSVLPPFADAISKYTGMVTVVTIVGPSGEDGNIIIRSTQSVASNDKEKQTWAQDSLFNYGRSYYSERECLACMIHDDLIPSGTQPTSSGGMVQQVQQLNASLANDQANRVRRDNPTSSSLCPRSSSGSVPQPNAGFSNQPSHPNHDKSSSGLFPESFDGAQLSNVGFSDNQPSHPIHATNSSSLPRSFGGELQLNADFSEGHLSHPLQDNATLIGLPGVSGWPQQNMGLGILGDPTPFNANGDNWVPPVDWQPCPLGEFQALLHDVHDDPLLIPIGSSLATRSLLDVVPAPNPTGVTCESNLTRVSPNLEAPNPVIIDATQGNNSTCVSSNLEPPFPPPNPVTIDAIQENSLHTLPVLGPSNKLPEPSAAGALPLGSEEGPTLPKNQCRPRQPRGNSGTKRKADAVNENANANVSDVPRTRHKVLLPAHLEAGGYQPPKKGSRRGGNKKSG